jgi:hypothetical protein
MPAPFQPVPLRNLQVHVRLRFPSKRLKNSSRERYERVRRSPVFSRERIADVALGS